MKTMTLTVTAFAALAAIATASTILSSSVSVALANAEGYSQPAMPIGQMTASAQNLPAQSLDAY